MKPSRSRRGPDPAQRLVAFGARIVVLSFAVWLASTVVEGIHLDGWESTVVVALILAVLNATVRPVLAVISVPITCLTLGLFLLFLNTAILALAAWIAGQFDSIDFAIDGFWAAFLGALVISAVAWVLSWFVPGKRR